jgi:DNA-directed RNA polymerase specialized sigma24 family protein
VAASDLSSAEELRKIGNVLALLLVRDMKGPEKVLTLNICGFSNKQAATVLGVTESYVRQALSRQRKRPSDVSASGNG